MPKNSLEDQKSAMTYVATVWSNLVIDEFNYELIKAWIQTSAGGDWTNDYAMAAVGELWVQLHKTSVAAPAPAPVPPAPTTPAPAAPAVAAEELYQLKDGSKQLPLDASEYTARRATLEQVRDLTRRRFAAESSSTLFLTKSHQKIQGDY